METDQKLVSLAMQAREMAYAPYSGFRVGAALLAADGTVYQGCNIENAAYTPTNCAERTAFYKAVSEGVRQFDAICIVGGKEGVLTDYTAPCGVCRQVMMEFCDPETFRVILAKSETEVRTFRLKELLPMGFGPDNLAAKRYKRIFFIVVDSLGVGAAEDAAAYGDVGTDTLGHISQSVETFSIPNLQKLGIANLHPLRQVAPVEAPLAYYTKMNERSRGKDTMTGHWEFMGLKTETPFITFTDTGFPPELIAELEARTGHPVIGNKSSSGTEILDELAEEEIATGKMIVYTSADSVLQICGNEETFDLKELYRCCEIARELTMKDEWKVGRVIARPYLGRKKGEFRRTSNRHDYALEPFGDTILDALKDNGLDVISIGKINDIFAGKGITEALKSQSSVHGMEQTIEEAKNHDFHGLCFVNLVDFDALWGHRRDPVGYAGELERFDEKLGELLAVLGEDDLLIITADHGNDPTYTGTDHTRERVPLLLYSKAMNGGGKLPETDSFGAAGATVAENFGVVMPEGTIGTSLLDQIK